MNHGWEKYKLCEIGRIDFGKRIVAKDTIPGPYYVYGGGGATFKSQEYNRENCMIISRFAMSPECVRFVKGKFFLNDSGLSVKSICDRLNQDFLDKYLWANQSNIYNMGRGAAQRNLNTKALADFYIQIPPIETQRQVAEELDKINELIEVKRSQLADLDLLAQSLFYEMFGDPIENPKGWNLYNLGDCVEFKNGLNFTPSDSGNEIKCLGVGNFKSNRYISDESLDSINIVELVSKEYLLEDGDIIFVRSNGNKALIGRSILYTSKGADVTFSGFCIRCRYSKEKYNPLYMAYLLSSKTIRHYMISQGKGCNISNINQKILSAMPFMVPPIELQNQFAAKIKTIEEQKTRIDSSLTDLQTLLANRMDYWFND